MTVAELIAKLQQMPQRMKVMIAHSTEYDDYSIWVSETKIEVFAPLTKGEIKKSSNTGQLRDDEEFAVLIS